MSHRYPATIHLILISPGHNYFGHPAGAPGEHPTHLVSAVQVHAGRGLVGDRFYGRGEDFDGHVTFFAWEVYRLLQEELGQGPWSAATLRRNVVVEGIPLNQLIGQEFILQGIRFRGTKHCAPCRWMAEMIGPEARRLLQGRGGLRAQALSSGVLRTGAAILETTTPLDLTSITAPLSRPRLP
ncbi:MOSC domain-containing protein [Litorilinea aerophila]|uniref:Molybdenum cofactor biosysynthesis protein n=1 Tax=Litorilinea aerophila TaxID=1204385 RepID=A0A540VAA7_9CHLR|nr:MOSC domain-containing protein [Litorilinea aerophila]MCC9078407.1 MOSC domain-containing protein [Litorilinea aerophila]GIV76049.1 MAG: hypothetical protein KatS3mg050_0443 [Litorilinea sp.]